MQTITIKHPVIECVSPTPLYNLSSQCSPCNPCGPDRIEGGSQCSPCNPCGPDRIEGGSQCSPCNPCGPDRIEGGSQCSPCNPCGPDRIEGDSNSGSGCFISSACIESLGLPDNCTELETLRRFRDEHKQIDTAFANLVDEYYAIAPEIVKKIDSCNNRKVIYSNLYEHLVAPCVSLINKDKNKEAIDLYVRIVRELQRTYL